MRVTVFDIGGTAVKYSLMEEDGSVLASGERPTPHERVEDLVALIADVHGSIGADSRGIAVSLPGLIDVEKGYCNTGGALAYNYGQPLGQLIGDACSCPVRLENDGKAAALAELRVGALRGVTNGCTLVLGTATGCGLVIDGQLVRGPRGAAGEASFMVLDPSNPGDMRSYMAYNCSASGLVLMVRAETGLGADRLPDGRAVFSLIESGDEAARRGFDAFCRLVAVQIYNLTALLDLERIAIGGGISANPLLVEGVREAYEGVRADLPEVLRGSTITPQIVRCTFGSEANQVGALHCFLDAWNAGKLG